MIETRRQTDCDRHRDKDKSGVSLLGPLAAGLQCRMDRRCDWVLGVLWREAWCNTSMTLKLVWELQTVGAGGGGKQNVPKGNTKGAPLVAKQQNCSNIKCEED